MLLASIWGASFLAITVSLREVGHFTSVAHRVFWAMIVLWGIAFAKGYRPPKHARQIIGLLGMGLLNNVIPFSLMAWGQLHIESGLTAILNAFTAVIGVVIAAIFLRDERLTSRKSIGVCLGFAGVVTAIGWSNLLSINISSVAQLAVIAGTFGYALAGVWARKLLYDLPPIVAAAGMLTASSLIMVPLALYFDGPIRFDLGHQTWAALGYISILGTAIAYLLYYRLLGSMGSGNLMLVTLLVVPIAITLGALILDETIAPRAFAGFAILALGLAILDGRLWKRMFR